MSKEAMPLAPRLRYELERHGHNPLLFFLKCLDADDARLPELSRDEIRDCEWFILGDRPNAFSPVEAWSRACQETELGPPLEKGGRASVGTARFLTGAAPRTDEPPQGGVDRSLRKGMVGILPLTAAVC